MIDKIQLLDALKRLLPSQFEEVLFRYEMPAAHLPPGAQAQQAIAVVRHAENRDELAQLARVIAEVAGSPGHAPASGGSAQFNQAGQQVQQQINIGSVGGNLHLQQAGRDIHSADAGPRGDELAVLKQQKLHALRKALILETDAATKFKLEQQITELEKSRP